VVKLLVGVQKFYASFVGVSLRRGSKLDRRRGEWV
jgi:hypothetical protein